MKSIQGEIRAPVFYGLVDLIYIDLHIIIV